MRRPATKSDFKVFRDPVHGDLLLSAGLVALLDTREVQRLRGVKQLGTASMVYPGAVHTRFDHSLGTCAMAGRLLDVLEDQGTEVSAEDRRVVLAAALVHDVGHIPFGHTIEDERRLFPRHDSPARLRGLLRRGELGRELRRQGLTEPVLALLTGRADPPWLGETVSGTVCADLLDYLARDAYFCGLHQRYDERILRNFRADGQGLYLDAQKDGIVREDVVSEVVNLLRLRYFLTERVFFHHTKTASGAMVSRAVEQATRAGLTLEDLLPLTDERLLALLETRFAGDPVVQRLLAALASRRLYKRAYVLTRAVGEERRLNLVERFHQDPDRRREAEERLAARLRFHEGELVVYCPAAGMQLKEAEVRLKVDPGPPRSLASLNVPEVAVLRDRHQDLWRFYVFVAPERMGRALQVSRECEEFFGLQNHLPALQSAQMYLGL